MRDGARIFVGQLFARAHLFRGAPEGERLDVEREDDVRSNAGDDGLDIVVQAAPDGGDTDHGGDPDDNSEHGERRPQLVAADRGRRHVHYLADFAFSHRNLVL